MLQKHKGLFVTFEGGEGAGKTTLIQRLSDHLKEAGPHAITTREPGGTPFGKHIRSLLLHPEDVSFGKKAELFLFLADRAQHVEEMILPALEKGGIVFCDRFNDSTLAYQGAARSLDRKFLNTLTDFAASNLKPDLTFFLDLDPEIGLRRSKSHTHDRIEKEDLSFHQKVRSAFLQLASDEPKRFCVLDGAQPPDHVFSAAKKALYAKLEQESCLG